MEGVAAAAGEDADAGGVSGDGPVDIFAGEVGGVVEGAGVAEIARAADFAVELEVLAVAEVGQVLVGLGVEGDLGAGARVELEDEALTLAGNGGGLDDAPADDDGFARSGLDFGRRARNVEAGGEGSGEEEGEVGAGEEEDAGGTEAREDR